MQLQYKDAFSLDTDALFSQFGSDFHQQDCFEQFPIQNAYGWTGKWPGFHLGYLGDPGRVWNPNKAMSVGVFYGSIVKFSTYATDVSFDRVAGEYDDNNYFSTWSNFGYNQYTPAITTGSLIQSGAVDNPGKFMCIDGPNRLFFIPRGYALYFDGPITATLVDYGRFIMSKSVSADYGGLYTSYLSPVGPIIKWDGSFRFGTVCAPDGLWSAATGAFNLVSSYIPVCVNTENDFCYTLPVVSENVGNAVHRSPMLYSALLPCFNTSDTSAFIVSASAQFHGKRFIPKQSGVMAVPYLGLNVL